MKIEPKGNIPAAAMITGGLIYQSTKGISFGYSEGRTGKSALLFQIRPNIVPRTVNGKEINNQIPTIFKIEDKCRAFVVS